MVQLGLQVGTIWIQKKHVQTQSTQIEKEDFIFIFVASVIYSLWKWISRKACWFLTQWELHKQWSSFYCSYFVKTYLFDIISFSLFYFSRVFILLQQDEEDVNLFQCYVDWLAEQYLWVLVLDYFGFRLGEVFFAYCQNCVCRIWNYCSNVYQVHQVHQVQVHTLEDSLRYKFILIEEYLKAVVRQYYVLGGCFVFPTISWIALPLQFFDYLSSTLQISTIMCSSFRIWQFFCNNITLEWNF